MSTTKKLMKMLILTATMICFGLLFANIANAEEPECKHVVYCDNPKKCILCVREDIAEEEISEIRHDLERNVKYVPEGKGHRITCECGKVVDEELDKHTISCTAEDLSVCSLCGAPAEDGDIVHFAETLFWDKEHHWLFCEDCNEMTSPLLDHYTLCTEPDGPCGFCKQDHDDCIFKEKFIGMHLDVDEVIEENGELYHISTCTECKQVIIRHKGIEFEDFGDKETHIVRCKVCRHQFGDAEHEYKNGVCIRCGRKEIPVTGDENNIIIWIAIMALASVCIFGFIRKFRKN